MSRFDKYYDWNKGRYLDMLRDGCNFIDWKKDHADFAFAKHPEGFPVFLSPDDIERSDEYKDSDPYRAEENMTNEFHQRRIRATLELLDIAAKDNKMLDDRILDIGCGEGHITSRIKKAYPQAEVSGLDYSVSAIRKAVKLFNDIDFIVADAFVAPYSPEYFDTIVCNNLWEHVPDPLRLLQQMKRIIKRNGHLIISTPSRYRTKNLVRAIFGKPVCLVSPTHITEYSVGQVLEQLRFGGFDVISVYSPPIRSSSKILVIKKTFEVLLKFLKSHHILEETVFYLARYLGSSQRQLTFTSPLA